MDSRDDRRTPVRLPPELVETLDGLDEPTLRAVLAHVQERLVDDETPTAELVRREAAGEVVEVLDRGAHALVKVTPSNGGDDSSSSVDLYRVSRERRPCGESHLHWTYLGDVCDGR